MDEITKQVYRETAQTLKGSDRRLFMARVVKQEVRPALKVGHLKREGIDQD